MKQIKDQVKTQKESMSKKNSEKNQKLVSQLLEEGVIDEVFGDRNHIQLIQRSQELVTYLMMQESLEDEDMNKIWACTLTDAQTKNEIYKVLSGAASTYHSTSGNMKNYLIKKMSELKPALFGEKELEMLLNVTRVVTSTSEYAANTARLLWRIIMQEDGYKTILIEKSLEKFNEIMRTSDKQILY